MEQPCKQSACQSMSVLCKFLSEILALENLKTLNYYEGKKNEPRIILLNDPFFLCSPAHSKTLVI